MKAKSLKEILELDPLEAIESQYDVGLEPPGPEAASVAIVAHGNDDCDCVDDETLPDHEHPPVGHATPSCPALYPEGKVTDFDKYMDKILISEGHGRPAVPPEDNPQRRRAARHQDRPGNKTRFGAK